MKISLHSLYSVNYGLPESYLKFITMKTTSESLGGNLAKFCTNKNLPTIWYTILLPTRNGQKIH